MQKLKILDLFSGIGGFSLGLERTGGFETVAFCEIEPSAQKVLKKHWPDVPIYEDIRNVTKEKLESDGIIPDIVTGGFPCQDLSTAGKQAGISGERSGLWGELKRLISEIRPQFAIVENVPALLSGDNGRWFGRVLGDLATIGYDAEWHCIPAYYVGSPQIRDRVWIIAYPYEDMFHGRSTLQNNIDAQIINKKNVDNQASLLLRYKRDELQTDRVSLRDDDGFSGGVDRLGVCGNAVVPQIVELLGYAILDSINKEK
ncbi:MAG: DNA (cytosine-5-)-methyltransferase [Nitrosopumilus sp.]|nr:DNA (cytosine-5-)-methyltransferase [Nitrosopumilus sp.]